MTTTTTSTKTKSAASADLRRQLEARRQEYLTEVERATAAAMDLADEGASQDIADEDGFGEGDTVSVERDRLMVVAGDAQARVSAIDAALARVVAGTYGDCESCRRPIPAARLEALPEATLCVACKSGALLRRR